MKSLINIPEKMKALVLYGVGDLRVTEVDVPKLEKRHRIAENKGVRNLFKRYAKMLCNRNLPLPDHTWS